MVPTAWRVPRSGVSLSLARYGYDAGTSFEGIEIQDDELHCQGVSHLASCKVMDNFAIGEKDLLLGFDVCSQPRGRSEECVPGACIYLHLH